MEANMTRREVGAKLIETPANLQIRLDRLIAFIAFYQDNHRGETPTVDAMANELSTTKQTVRYWLGILEIDGRIRRIGQNPLRLMLKEGARPIEAARKRDDISTGKAKNGWAVEIAEIEKQERFDGAEGRRFALARFIGEFWNTHSRAPSLHEMMKGIGTTAGATVAFMLSALEDKGIIERPNKSRLYEVRLTENGKIAVGCKSHKEVPKMAEQDTTKLRSRLADARATKAKKFEAKVREIHAYMEGYQRKEGFLPAMRIVAEQFGYCGRGALQKPMHKMVEMGLIELGRRGYLDARLLQTDLPPAHHRWPNGGLAPKGNYATSEKAVARNHSLANRMTKAAQMMDAHHRQYGVWPGLTEVSLSMGYHSTGAARRTLDVMLECGFAEKVVKDARYSPYRLLPKGRELIEEKETEPMATTMTVDEALQHVGNSNPPILPGGGRAISRNPADVTIIADLKAELAETKRRLAEALTAAPPAPAQEMTQPDMILALIDAGFIVRRA